ncbi:hypothetical protein PRUPE_2G299700 [Prunus persica]|uniref:Uncharacterized protein n=1 Tax=Prunus persica TaxID=3760 RepID=M5XJJ5_PRUPE|nr:hypothetical protein PRUPE_2G299700 [Prunus persica]
MVNKNKIQVEQSNIRPFLKKILPSRNQNGKGSFHKQCQTPGRTRIFGLNYHSKKEKEKENWEELLSARELTHRFDENACRGKGDEDFPLKLCILQSK